MKVAIVGSRDFDWSDHTKYTTELGDYTETNYHTKGMRSMIHYLVSFLLPTDYVVSGGANGADFWAETSASIHKVGRIVHEADWDKLKRDGKSGERWRGAGPKRNTLIVHDADILFAFATDLSTSRGTMDSIDKGTKKGIPVYVWNAKHKVWLSVHPELGLDDYGPVDVQKVLAGRRGQVDGQK